MHTMSHSRTLSRTQGSGYHQGMDKTLRYYDEHAAIFTADTLTTDMSAIQEAFIRQLHPGAHILDLGCGSGRDSKLFLSKGFAVTPVDGSGEMCTIAKAYTGLEVRQLLFKNLDYIEAFDAVWACASLLHVPSNDLPHIFALIHRALKSEGLFYSSFKYGTFERERNGRFFTDMTEDGIRKLLSPLFTPIRIWTTSDTRPGRSDEKWLNVTAISKQL